MSILFNTNPPNTQAEFPIFGAPFMFELIRSYNRVNGQNNTSSQYISNKKAALGFLNDTSIRYKGTSYDALKPIAFNRKDNGVFNPANPTFKLTKKNIDENANKIEQEFVCSKDTYKIKAAIEDYWSRIQSYDDYAASEITSNTMINSSGKYQGYFPSFHLIYAYMIENTKIFQIFKKIITLYLSGEDLTIPYNSLELDTKPWIENTHKLFFSNQKLLFGIEVN